MVSTTYVLYVVRTFNIIKLSEQDIKTSEQDVKLSKQDIMLSEQDIKSSEQVNYLV